jgi:predicted esterase
MTLIQRTQQRSLAAEVKLYYDLGVPADTTMPAPLLIALHGYGDNKAWMMREARKLAPQGFAVAALQGFHQHMKKAKQDGAPFGFGFGWLTNFRAEESVALHHQALLDLIETLVREGVALREQIYLLGFSQSVALNYRFVFAYQTSCAVLSASAGLARRLKRAKFTWLPKLPCCICAAHAMSLSARARRRLLAASKRARRRCRTESYDAAHDAPAMRDDDARMVTISRVNLTIDCQLKFTPAYICAYAQRRIKRLITFMTCAFNYRALAALAFASLSLSD